jgi:ribosomal protein L32
MMFPYLYQSVTLSFGMRVALFAFYTCRGRVARMSVRMRHTRSHTKNRRSHHALEAVKSVPTEKGRRLPHRIDEETGMYRGRQIVSPKVKKEQKEEKVVGPRTYKELPGDHKHEKHDHEHENAKQTKPRNFFGRIMNARPKSRSGAGGGGA